jgi:hypothetical protein
VRHCKLQVFPVGSQVQTVTNIFYKAENLRIKHFIQDGGSFQNEHELGFWTCTQDLRSLCLKIIQELVCPNIISCCQQLRICHTCKNILKCFYCLALAAMNPCLCSTEQCKVLPPFLLTCRRLVQFWTSRWQVKRNGGSTRWFETRSQTLSLTKYRGYLFLDV